MQEYQFEQLLEALNRIATALEKAPIDYNAPLLVSSTTDPFIEFAENIRDERIKSKETS